MLLTHDVVIVGSGVAGMRAAVELRRKLPTASIALVTKLYPSRANSVLSQDGLAAALGNGTADGGTDDWLTHMYDTVRMGQFAGDQDAQELLCREAAGAIYELEHMGVPFTRRADGRLAQRAADGHSAPRVAYAGDRTGHHVVQTLYGELVRYNVTVYPEWYVLDLVLDGGRCQGVTALDIRSGEVHGLAAKATLLAAGGYGRVFSVTSQSQSSTGDVLALAYRAGLPLQNMDRVAWAPLGLAKHGIVIDDAVLADGALLVNALNARFMERQGAAERSGRRAVTEAIGAETAGGRGVGSRGDQVYLDLRQLDPDLLAPRLHEATEQYLGLNPSRDLIPVQPTADYTLGGLATELDGRVVSGGQPVGGLYAAGQCASGTMHGAAVLPGNTLLAAVVFGAHVGGAISAAVGGQRGKTAPTLAAGAVEGAEAEVKALLARRGREHAADLRRDLQSAMYRNLGPARTTNSLEQQVGITQELRERFAQVGIDDRSRRFNTELVELLELSRMLEVSEAVVGAALSRSAGSGQPGHTLVARDPSGQRRSESGALRYGPQGPRFNAE